MGSAAQPAGFSTPTVSMSYVVTVAPYCHRKQLLTLLVHAGISYGSRNVLADAALREGIKKFTSWPTIPQVGDDTTVMLSCVQATPNTVPSLLTHDWDSIAGV